MNDYLHYLLSTQISDCETRLWDLVKTHLGKSRTKETVNRFNRIVKQVIRPNVEAIKAESAGLEAPKPRDNKKAEEVSQTEYSLVLAILLTEWAADYLDNGNAEDCLKTLLRANETLGGIRSTTPTDGEKREMLSAIGKMGAAAIHVENRAMRTQALEWYASHKHEYSSKEEAAMEITKIVPVKFRTARDWLINQ